MANLNIQLPELINNANDSSLVLRYDKDLEITTGIRTDGIFQNFIMKFQNWFDSSKQWVPVQTREGNDGKTGKIVYVQKSKAAFDRKDTTRPEVIEALYVEKVWRDSEKVDKEGIPLGSLGYTSISAKRKKAKMLNSGYLLRQDGSVLIEEKSKGTIANGVSKKMKIVVDMNTGERLARLIVKRNAGEVDKVMNNRSSRLQAEHRVLQEYSVEKVEGVVKVHGDLLMKKGKPSLLEELFDDSLPDGNGKLPQKIIKKWKSVASQLIHGLAAIHAKGASHNDIKGPNLLYREEENGKIKIVFTDFELSSSVTGHGNLGSPFYCSPEKAKAQFEKKVFSPEEGQKADVWALGIELYRLRHGEYPEFLEKVDLYGRGNGVKMKDLQQTHIFKKPKDEKSFDYLIWKMLQVNPEERFDMSQVRERWDQIQESL